VRKMLESGGCYATSLHASLIVLPVGTPVLWSVHHSQNYITGARSMQVSGGVVDGDEEHPDYRYGGLW